MKIVFLYVKQNFVIVYSTLKLDLHFSDFLTGLHFNEISISTTTIGNFEGLLGDNRYIWKGNNPIKKNPTQT